VKEGVRGGKVNVLLWAIPYAFVGSGNERKKGGRRRGKGTRGREGGGTWCIKAFKPKGKKPLSEDHSNRVSLSWVEAGEKTQ